MRENGRGHRALLDCAILPAKLCPGMDSMTATARWGCSCYDRRCQSVTFCFLERGAADSDVCNASSDSSASRETADSLDGGLVLACEGLFSRTPGKLLSSE